MSHAQMIAKAWLDDGYRSALIAQGIEVPARPSDLAEEELVTSVKANGEGGQLAIPCGALPCSCNVVPCS